MPLSLWSFSPSGEGVWLGFALHALLLASCLFCLQLFHLKDIKEASEYFIRKSVFISNLKRWHFCTTLPPPTIVQTSLSHPNTPYWFSQKWRGWTTQTSNDLKAPGHSHPKWTKAAQSTPCSCDFNIVWTLCPTTSICVCSENCLPNLNFYLHQ